MKPANGESELKLRRSSVWAVRNLWGCARGMRLSPETFFRFRHARTEMETARHRRKKYLRPSNLKIYMACGRLK